MKNLTKNNKNEVTIYNENLENYHYAVIISFTSDSYINNSNNDPECLFIASDDSDYLERIQDNIEEDTCGRYILVPCGIDFVKKYFGEDFVLLYRINILNSTEPYLFTSYVVRTIEEPMHEKDDDTCQMNCQIWGLYGFHEDLYDDLNLELSKLPINY